MANNCLITKLKASVNNDSLDKLGMFSVFFKQEESPTQNSRYLLVVSTEKNTMESMGGLFYKTYGGTSLGKSYTFVDSDWSEQYGGYVFSGYVSNTACRVDISKYTLKRVQVTADGVYDIDLSKFKYTQVQYFSGSYLSGSVADLPDNTTYVNFNGNLKIKGTLADFSRLTSITYLDVANSSIEPSLISSLGPLKALTTMQIIANGSIESFVEAQRDGKDGRTTCDGITCAYLGAGNITFRGEQIVNKASATLTWTASTITYDGVTIPA